MRHARRGAIYIYVLTSSALVTVIGLGAMYAIGVQRREAEIEAAFRRAAIACESGLDTSSRWIESADWPIDATAAPWSHTLAVGSDSTVEVALETLPSGAVPTDPVALRIVGASGAGTVRERAEVVPGRAMSALDAGVVVGSTLTVTGGRVASAMPVAVRRIVADRTSIDAPVEVLETWSGSAFNGDLTRRLTAREMPPANEIVAAYAAQGVRITLERSIKSGRDEAVNGSPSEGSIDPWVPADARVIADFGALADDGDSRHFRIQDRQSATAGMAQVVDVQWDASSGIRVGLSARAADRQEQLRLRLAVQTEDGGEHDLVRDVGPITPDASTRLDASFEPVWTSPIVQVTLAIETAESAQTLLVDGISVQELRIGPPTLADTVLAPAANDDGVTNAEGVWVIECAGESVRVENCRIVGTLVLLDPGPETVLAGAISLEPLTPTEPALLSDGPVTLALDRSVLSERTVGRTLNPVGAPWPIADGGSDADLDDAYRSMIDGLILIDGDAIISGRLVLGAPLLVTGSLRCDDALLAVRADGSVADDPPAGFDQFVPSVRFVRGSRLPVLASDW